MGYRFLVVLYFVFFWCQLLGVSSGLISIVYVLQIAQANKSPTGELKPYGLAFTSFEQARWERTQGNKSNAVGEEFTFAYTNGNLFTRIDFAFARVSEVSNGKPFSRVQTDDLLLTAGYTWENKNVKYDVSGLIGVPTHKDTNLDHVQFGIAHLGLGVQFDFLIKYLPKNDNIIKIIFRSVGFLPRSASYQGRNYNYNIGDAIDVLLAHYASFGNHHFEVGYDATFVFGGFISPNVSSISSQITLIRNSYYAIYSYNFISDKIIQSINFGIGFSSPDILPSAGQKLIAGGWFTWTLAF